MSQIDPASDPLPFLHHHLKRMIQQLVRRFKVMVMPTQVALSSKETEAYQDEGFLERDVFFTVLTGQGAI